MARPSSSIPAAWIGFAAVLCALVAVLAFQLGRTNAAAEAAADDGLGAAAPAATPGASTAAPAPAPASATGQPAGAHAASGGAASSAHANADAGAAEAPVDLQTAQGRAQQQKVRAYLDQVHVTIGKGTYTDPFREALPLLKDMSRASLATIADNQRRLQQSLDALAVAGGAEAYHARMKSAAQRNLDALDALRALSSEDAAGRDALIARERMRSDEDARAVDEEEARVMARHGIR